VELTGKLEELRWWAGQPSLRRLRQLGGAHRTSDGADEVDALPQSTTSYMLRGDRPASAEFVRSFVAACLRARQRDPAEIADHVERWHQAWLAATGNATHISTEPVMNPIPTLPVPRQLPADVAGFTGRSAELAALDRLPGCGRAAAAEPVVVAVTGAAGVGKTALVVHAAHRLANRFPDGQVFIDLHGFTAGVGPVGPGAALDRLVRGLGVASERIPAELDDRAALWRSVLAGRRLLVVLDNAATEDQVRPLLPGAPGCVVLVTSRRRLTGLAASHPLPLDLLPATDALALFARAAHPAGSAGAPPELAAGLVELCGRLPLAIQISAARMRAHPAWSVADLAERLRDQNGRLLELADDAGPRSVAAALAVSYQQLTTGEQDLYRRLGRHPGADIDRYATAALLDTSPSRAERLLHRLLDGHLLQEPTPGRYTLHDLVRAHARQLAGAGPGSRGGRGWSARRRHRAVLTRLLDYYRHTAAAAMDTAYPYERDRRPRVPPARSPVPDLADPAAAAGWLDRELPNLLAVARHAAGSGWPEYACQLSALLHRHLRTRARYPEAEELHRLALTTRHRSGELDALIGLGRVHQMRGRHQPALDTLGTALTVARATGNRAGQVDALVGLGWVQAERGCYEQALDGFAQAADLARATGDRTGQLNALVGLGRIHQMKGRYPQALDLLGSALAIARTTGNPPGQLNALIGLGRVHRLRGEHEPAFDRFTLALDIARATGDRTGELNALRGIAHIHLLRRRPQQGIDALNAALEIARYTGNSSGELGALIGLGHAYRQQDRHELATTAYRAARRLAREVGDRNWQFEALHGLGRVHHAAGRPDSATTQHRRALELAIELGQPSDQARAHDGLAHAHLALGRHPQARRHWRHALDILTGLGAEHTEEEEVSAPAIRGHLAILDLPEHAVPDSTGAPAGSRPADRGL
jgi:tetratricopeptide (TPR) repeat protein